MARYLVRARPKAALVANLRRLLDSGEVNDQVTLTMWNATLQEAKAE